MLSKEDKNRIQLEEQYRLEVAKQIKQASGFERVEKAIKILQAIAIIAGVWATYTAYQKQVDDRIIQEKQNAEQAAREYRKGFYEKQFQFYAEALDATATLATEEYGSADYKEARKNFYRLFWGKLSIVEDKTVEANMVKFEQLLNSFEADNNRIDAYELKQASLRLAHAASRYSIQVWLDSTEQKNYNR